MNNRADRGSASAEVVLLAPLLVVLVLFVAHVGQLGTTHIRMITIADHAARAASQTHPRSMVQAGRTAATDNALTDDLPCRSFEVRVDVQHDTDPKTVSVTVVCELSREGLGLLAPTSRSVRVTSTEVVDRWRADL